MGKSERITTYTHSTINNPNTLPFVTMFPTCRGCTTDTNRSAVRSETANIEDGREMRNVVCMSPHKNIQCAKYPRTMKSTSNVMVPRAVIKLLSKERLEKGIVILEKEVRLHFLEKINYRVIQNFDPPLLGRNWDGPRKTGL